MVKIDLKGVAKVTAKGRVYWYAWRGGPRLEGKPGTPEFIASFNKAVEELRAPDTSKFRSLVASYKASNDFSGLAKSTSQKWARWLDHISDYFGDLSIAQFERPEKIRPIIRQWRSQWTDKPRTADLALQVLSRVLSYAVDPLGKLAGNPCEGVKRLYSSDRSAIIALPRATTNSRRGRQMLIYVSCARGISGNDTTPYPRGLHGSEGARCVEYVKAIAPA